MSAPIGVYDSGFGGLTVLRALMSVLPNADFVYLGDSGRAPYGGRDTHTILDFSEQCVEHLFDSGCRLVIVACHTVSCVGLRHLQRRYAPGPRSDRRVLGVTIPAAEAAVATTQGHIGILGTQRTIMSGTFGVEIAKLSSARVTQVPAPLLAPLVEEGLQHDEIARLAVRRYLHQLGDADTIVLGCTHYPLLIEAFRAELRPGAHLLDPGPEVARRLLRWLAAHPEFEVSGRGGRRYLCTGDPQAFTELGARFLGESLPQVGHISAEAGRLEAAEGPRLPVGQVVRS